MPIHEATPKRIAKKSTRRLLLETALRILDSFSFILLCSSKELSVGESELERRFKVLKKKILDLGIYVDLSESIL